MTWQVEVLEIDEGLVCLDCQDRTGERIHVVFDGVRAGTVDRCTDCGGDRIEELT